MTDKGVEDREQDGSACAAKECKQQEQNIFDQQDDSTCASEEGGLQKERLLNQRDLEQHKSSDQEADVMGHVENRQPLVECNSKAQMEAMKSSMAEGFTLHDLSHAKPNSNWPMPSGRTKHRPVRLAYQPPASSTFLSQQTSHQQPASSTLLLEQTSTSHQPPANRTGWHHLFTGI
jgi:hypothetical protein